MARPKTLQNDAVNAEAVRDAQKLHEAFSLTDNRAFLDAFIDAVWRRQNRLFGSSAYLAWMRVAGIPRRPNAATVGRAIDRAWSSLAAAVPNIGGAAVSSSGGNLPSGGRIQSSEYAEISAARDIAYRRVRELEAQVATLLDEAGKAKGEALALRTAFEGITTLVAEKLDRAGEAAKPLLDAAEALMSTERFLKAQTDAGRQLAAQAANQWKARADHLAERCTMLEEMVDMLKRQLRR